MNVLIVEDELLVALVYQHFLSKKGVTIEGPFTTGQEAIEFIETNDFSAVILDIQLDDSITGIQVAEKIRSKTSYILSLINYNMSKLREFIFYYLLILFNSFSCIVNTMII